MSRAEKLGSTSEMSISDGFDTKSETGIIPGGRGDGTNKATIVVLAVAIVMSTIAIILGAVVLSRPVSSGISVMTSNTQASGSGNNRIWTVAMGHDWGAYEYFDTDGYIKGFNLEFVQAVCKEAGMDCRLVWDRYTNCYNSEAGEHPRGGQGLFDRWYDACAGWSVTISRNYTFAFSDSYLGLFPSIFHVKKGNVDTFNGKDLKNRKIVFLDGWGHNEQCLARQQDDKHQNYILPKENIIHVNTPEQAAAILNNGTAYALFAGKKTMLKYQDVEPVPGMEFNCYIRGNSMMTRKDSDFNKYFNIGFRKFRENGGFKDLCQQAKDDHGDQGVVNCYQP